jgi:hypothetical protein
MTPGLALALLLSATPEVTADGLEPRADVERAAVTTWESLAKTWTGATDAPAPPAPPSLRLKRAQGLAATQSGLSRPGLALVRQNRPGLLDEATLLALRHELAHQFLWSACPAAAEDRLFHEAFAIATSGELPSWLEGPYLSLPQARVALEEAGSLDTREARRAIARLLADGDRAGELHPVLAKRLVRCADDGEWRHPVEPDELVSPAALPDGDALVAISRDDGRVLLAQGAVRAAMPYGSTLKPFIVGGAGAQGPVLRPRAGSPEWRCGEQARAEMDVTTALLLSCNGYFLDWGAKSDGVYRFGELGAALLAGGLPRLPGSMAEAIGLKATLRISPLGLAQAYRVLAQAQPKVLAMMQGNAERGTLSGLDASSALFGLALKTGTVRDAESRARLGWIVLVDDRRVVVMARKGRMPRLFAGEFATAYAKLPAP